MQIQATDRRLWRAGLSILLGLLMASSSVFGQSARIHTSVDSVGIGEPFPLYIVAQTPLEGRIVPPNTTGGPVSFGPVTLLELEDYATVVHPRGGREDSLTYRASVFGVDSVQVGPIMLGLRGAGADTTFFSTPSFYLPIRSLVPEDAQRMYDLAPLAQFPRSWWPWVLGAIGLLGLLALLWYLYQRRRTRIGYTQEEQAPALTPFDEAMARLAQLQETEWTNRETIKPFHVALTETLRWYLSQTLRVPALEQTTRELMRDLKHVSERSFLNFPPTLFTKTKQVLDLSDMVKFADQYPQPEDNKAILAQTEEVIKHYHQVYIQRIAPVLAEQGMPKGMEPQHA